MYKNLFLLTTLAGFLLSSCNDFDCCLPDKYRLTYFSNGGSGGKPVEAYTHGSLVTVADDTGLTPPIAGLTFVGWNTRTDGSGDYYAPGATFGITADMTLSAQWSGDGSSAASPILLMNYALLNDVRNGLNKHYKMIADIDADSWVPIGDLDTRFTGVFDGNGHTVTINGLGDVALSPTGSRYAGLFGALAVGSMVQNLRVAGSLSMVTDNNNYCGLGGIAGYNYGTIKNCVVSADIDLFANPSTPMLLAYAGGITGLNRGTIQNCYSLANISAEQTSGSSFAGGITGYGFSSQTNNCYATGGIEAKAAISAFAGGIVGENTSGSTTLNCVALNESITSTSSLRIGRVVGSNSATITNNWAWELMPGTWGAADTGNKEGGNVSLSNVQTQSWYSTNLPTWDFGVGGDWKMTNGNLPKLQWEP